MGIGAIGFQELIIIFLIVALLFGARRIPEIARGIGQAIKEFKKAVKRDEEGDKISGDKEEEKKDEESDRKV